MSDESDLKPEDIEAALAEARQRLAETPAPVVVTNHVMGLYELAAIHLSAEQPDLASASLAIDAVAALVEGLGDRLGPEAQTLRDALANIRMAFVTISNRAAGTEGDAPAESGDDAAESTPESTDN